jgi:SAM-dependent methyltransferase
MDTTHHESLSGVLARVEAGMGSRGAATGWPARARRLGQELRLRAAAALIDPKPGESVLDYGAGHGRLLTLLRGREANARLVGFEPVLYDEACLRLKGTADDIARDIMALRGEAFDTVVCLNLTERRPDADVARIIDDLVAHTRVDGHILVCVPAWTERDALAGRREPAGFSAPEGLGDPAVRRWLKRPGLALMATRYWPLPLLGPALNRHAFLLFRRLGRT